MIARNILLKSVRNLRRPLARAFSDRKDDKDYTKNETFGFKKVQSEERQSLVNSVFSNVASAYDVMNDLMSFGVHRLWKDYFINEAGVLKPKRIIENGRVSGYETVNIIDVAGGTGDIAFKLLEKHRKYDPSLNNIKVTVYDINSEMLKVGQSNATNRGISLDNLDFVEGNAENLAGIPDNSVDLYTISFGIRNVTNIPQALKEAHRVLKKGGRFMCLEFSKVQNPMFREIYKQYSFNVIPAVGKLVANDYDSYKYLVESIEMFLTQEEFKKLIQEAGFKNVTYTNLTNGIVALHSGFKL
jgi:2-methoxy-6-polyprenyl-1,4-benzoquinol methylase